MDCIKVRELFSDYIDNLISSEERAELECHLEECESCRNEFNELMNISALLSDLPEVTLPESFDSRLHEALLAVNAETERVVVPVRKKKSFMKRMSSVAAIFVVGLFAITMYNNSDQLMFDKAMESADSSMQIIDVNQDYKDKGDNYRVELYASDSMIYTPVVNATMNDAVLDESISDGTSGGTPEADFTEPSEGEFIETPMDKGTSGTAVSRGPSAYDKLMLLYSTDGAIFVGRDLTAVQYYSELLDTMLEDTEFEILSCEKEDGIWKFKVETISTDVDGNETRETIIYLGQDGNLWIEEE